MLKLHTSFSYDYFTDLFRGLWLERSKPHVRKYIKGVLISMKILKRR